MTKTVTSLFQSEQHATAAASRLKQAGIPDDAIEIWSTPHNLAPVLEDAGVSRDDANAYVEGVIRGGSAVIVSCTDDQVRQAVSILDHEGVLDLDEQQTSWRSEGRQEHDAAGLDGSPTPSSRPAQASGGTGHDLTGSPDMTPAKADMETTDLDEMSHGRVRVHSRRVEPPGER
jgi:hypothetical protein